MIFVPLRQWFGRWRAVGFAPLNRLLIAIVVSAGVFATTDDQEPFQFAEWGRDHRPATMGMRIVAKDNAPISSRVLLMSPGGVRRPRVVMLTVTLGAHDRHSSSVSQAMLRRFDLRQTPVFGPLAILAVDVQVLVNGDRIGLIALL